MLTAVERFGAFAPRRLHGTFGPRARGIGALRRACLLLLAALERFGAVTPHRRPCGPQPHRRRTLGV
eukprot:8037511-Lingulodinium_polyedra.AAC.1